MKIDVWFSKKIHFVGEHGDIDVEIYDYPVLEDGTLDKERLVLKDTLYVANLKQAIRRAMEHTAPSEVLCDFETILKVLEAQNTILKNFVEQFYSVYKLNYGTTNLEVCEPKHRGCEVVMPMKSKAKIVRSGTDMGGESEDVNEESVENVKAPAKREKKSKAEIKSIKKGN